DHGSFRKPYHGPPPIPSPTRNYHQKDWFFAGGCYFISAMRIPLIILIWICCVAGLPGQQHDSAASLIAQGNLLRDRLDYRGAVEMYRQALQYDPRNEEAYDQLLWAYLETGDFDRSLEIAVEASHLHS